MPKPCHRTMTSMHSSILTVDNVDGHDAATEAETDSEEDSSVALLTTDGSTTLLCSGVGGYATIPGIDLFDTYRDPSINVEV